MEVAFDDCTALLFELGVRITTKPMYSDWKTGDQRVRGGGHGGKREDRQLAISS